MPIPEKEPHEDKKKFVSRCMSSEVMQKEYPDVKQRVAICLGQTKKKGKASILDTVLGVLGFSLGYFPCTDCPDLEEEINDSNFMAPGPDQYIDFGEEADSSEYKGHKVTLNKPFRTPDGPKKFAVYVKNDKGKIVIVRFGDPNMKIKKDIPERRKSFRARMRCDTPGPRWKARYWACKSW